MKKFSDFDAWGDAISGASLQMACDGIETRAWTIAAIELGDVVLQMATEGGGNICYGGNAHAGTILFLPLTHAAAHVVNGERLDDCSLLAIPRGADFRIHVHKRAHSWCSIALPFDVPTLSGPTAANARVATCCDAVPRLRRLAVSITETLMDQPANAAAHEAAGRELTAAAVACLRPTTEPAPSPGRPRLDRATIIRRAMTVIDDGPTLPTAAELATSVGVTSRTLLRAFHESFGVSPKRYLILRELHAIRRALQAVDAATVKVADVLGRHGIWEFGRFASRYRRQFGELPSETLRHTLG